MRENAIIYMSESAYTQAVAEANKFYELGIQNSKAPWEAAMFPLAAVFVKRGVEKSPVEMIHLDEIKEVVVTRIAIPDDKYKTHSPGSAKFQPKGEDWERMNAEFNDHIQDILYEHPLLACICKMHSHPFSGRAFLSFGDVAKSIMNIPDSWFRNLGINTVISMVMTLNKAREWEIHCYGLTRWRYNISLGRARIINDSSERIQQALSMPYYISDAGNDWELVNLAALKEQNLKPFRIFFVRGWKGFVFEPRQNKQLLICLPPFFPKGRALAYWVKDLKNFQFEKTGMPKHSQWASTSDSIKDYLLLELAAHFRRRK